MHAKTLLTVAATLFALALPMAGAQAHVDHGKPQFGGVVAEAGEAQFEIVSADGKITVHASNHGAPVATDGVSGKLTILAGAEKREVLLKAAGANRLTGEGTYSAGAKLLLQVQWPGKAPLQARVVVR